MKKPHKSENKTQRQRFIDAARKAEASEDEAVFDETLKRLAQAKPKPLSDDDLRAVLSSIEDSTEYLGVELNAIEQRGHFGNTPLKVAAVRGDLHATRVLLDAGADVNAIVEDGFTALHFAASQGHPEVVKLLLQRGASPKILNSEGRTAMELAQLLGNHEVMKAFKLSMK